MLISRILRVSAGRRIGSLHEIRSNLWADGTAWDLHTHSHRRSRRSLASWLGALCVLWRWRESVYMPPKRVDRWARDRHRFVEGSQWATCCLPVFPRPIKLMWSDNVFKRGYGHTYRPAESKHWGHSSGTCNGNLKSKVAKWKAERVS
jgi:hypothetical protein